QRRQDEGETQNSSAGHVPKISCARAGLQGDSHGLLETALRSLTDRQVRVHVPPFRSQSSYWVKPGMLLAAHVSSLARRAMALSTSACHLKRLPVTHC